MDKINKKETLNYFELNEIFKLNEILKIKDTLWEIKRVDIKPGKHGKIGLKLKYRGIKS